jgi:uncharacterized protein (TIGR03083 family)
MADLAACGPILTAPLFAPLGEDLLALLRSLDAADWRKPTVAPAWSVQDIAAHLLDTAWRRLSSERDSHAPAPDRAIASYEDLVDFLNDLNRTWVEAWRRVSPRILLASLETAEHGLAAHLPTIDPWAPARFSVAWAGEDVSLNWFDQARELTERWHHQQQIRLAVGAPVLDDPRFSRPVLETFLCVLPHRYASVARPDGTTLALEIVGRERYAYALRREGAAWRLLAGHPAGAAASVSLGEQDAWLMLTKGLSGDAARDRSTVMGDIALAAPLFGALAIMARS